MLSKYFRLIRGYIIKRKIRTFLTILGVFIGITSVFSLISIGQGAQEFIDSQFETAGSNRIQVLPGGGDSSLTSAPGSSLISAKLYEDDVDVVERSRGVEFAHGYLLRGSVVSFRGENKAGFVLAIPTDPVIIDQIKETGFFKVEKGRNLRSSDKRSVVIGYKTANSFFSHDVGIGDKIEIDGVLFDVVGITTKTGNPLQDRRIIMPMETAKEIYNAGEEVSLISATAKDGFDVNEVSENIKKDLRKYRNVKKGEEDFTVSTTAQLAETFNSIIGVFSLFIIGIAAISLIVGGVGIMNSMYTSVLERTRDIGIMKAVGARNIDIISIFIIESGLLGLVGGIMGVIFGALLGKAAEVVAVASGIDIFRSYITIELVAGSLLFSFLVGAIAGLLPALEASAMKPVEAMRRRK